MSEPLEYEDLLRAYDASLITVLRGFTAGVPFLATWVPEEDHAFSILGVFEAASDAGQPQLSLGLTGERLEEVGRQRLLDLLSPLGDVDVSENSVSVLFGANPVSVQSSPIRSHTRIASQRVETSGEDALPLEQGWDLPALYHRALDSASEPMPHRLDDARRLGLHCERLGVCLSVRLGEEHRVIEAAGFSGEMSGQTAALLEFCCRNIEGLPLYEAADHGVIALEAALRDGPRPALGIVLAERSVPAFALLNQMLRNLNQQAGGRVANFFEPPVAAKWRKSDDEGKMTALRVALSRHPLGDKAAVVRVEGQRRVVVGFTEDGLNNAERQQALLELERHFKTEVEPALHLYLEPKPDKNKLRQQKGIRL